MIKYQSFKRFMANYFVFWNIKYRLELMIELCDLLIKEENKGV